MRAPPAARASDERTMLKTGNTAQDLLLRGDLTALRVLIVDQHSNARDSLRMMLASLGITRVQGAGSSAEALRLVNTGTFEVIFSDYQLGDGRDGQQLLEELRVKQLISRATVFIIITSERGYHSVVSLAELTPDDYLIKPFTGEQLQSRLARALHAKQSLSPILRQLDATAYGKALAACDKLLSGGDDVPIDALRLKGEILNQLGRHEEAKALFGEVLATRPLPWAKMGLAVALRARGELDAAIRLGRELVGEQPHFLAAHDLLAALLEESGALDAAQAVLVEAAGRSPHNSLRQRLVGDVAARNGDLDLAEKAYQKVLARTRGSSLSKPDDYANLSRVLLDNGKPAAARGIAQELRRDRRWDPVSELAAAIVDSLSYQAEGETTRARDALDRALDARAGLGGVAAGVLSEKISVDLAHACLANGRGDEAAAIMRQVAAEHQEDKALLTRIGQVFDRTDNAAVGRAILDEVSRELIDINNRGVLIAREGRLEESVQLLSDAADRIANIQFLVNAASAIFTLLDRRGWNDQLALRGACYLLRAQQRDAGSQRVIAAGELLQAVAQKSGRSASELRQQALDATGKR